MTYFARVDGGLSGSQSVGDLLRNHLIKKFIRSAHLCIQLLHTIFQLLALFLLLEAFIARLKIWFSGFRFIAVVIQHLV